MSDPAEDEDGNGDDEASGRHQTDVKRELEAIQTEMEGLSERMEAIRATLDEFETGEPADEDVDPEELAERLDKWQTGDPDG